MPLAYACVAAIFVAGDIVFAEMTGYQERGYPRATPVPFADAWSKVPDLAGVILFVTFLVFAVKARVWPGGLGGSDPWCAKDHDS